MKARPGALFVACGLAAAFTLTATLSPIGATSNKVDKTAPPERLVPDQVDPMSPPERRAWTEHAYGQRRGTSPTQVDPGVDVIYGADDRKEIYEILDADLAAAAEAVCLVVDISELADNGNGTYSLSAVPWAGSICTYERFYGQLNAGFCTGFLVGDSILTTAGHCADAATCGATAFVFSWYKPDASTAAPVIIPAADVYFCAGIIDQAYAGDLDHSVIRLDRAVTGRSPLRIRRTGTVSAGDSLSVIGHPSTIPAKEAGGAIVQNANGTVPWFQANLDTYGGNSGSPVFNRTTYEVEGILVRGAPDFNWTGSCYESNVVPNSGNPGSGLEFEEVSKTTQFQAFIPALVSSTGTVNLTRTAYGCSDTASVEMRDADLQGTGAQSVDLTTDGGDLETVTVTETAPSSGIFRGATPTAAGVPAASNGVLEVSEGETITAIYMDADAGSGSPATVTDSATVDCTTPVISNLQILNVVGTRADVTFDTDEPAGGLVRYGTSCGALTGAAGGASLATSHSIQLSGLSPLTPYYLAVEATDVAGNTGADDNGGGCFTLTTLDQADYFTEEFASADGDLDFLTITFAPDGSGDYYSACTETTAVFPTDPASGTSIALTDDDSFEVPLSGGEQVYLYGVAYGSCFVGSNGYLTFGASSTDFTETLSEHFGAPPRVAALYDDLDPTSGGTVSYLQTADRMAITYQGVPEYNSGTTNDFQVELHFDGKITITHLSVAALDGIVGLSAGTGVPADFVEWDLSTYAICVCEDTDGDGICYPPDNCPDSSNASQLDGDDDGHGDACDNCPGVTNVIQDSTIALTGDVNRDSVITTADVLYMVNFVFTGGFRPAPCEAAGDVNCDDRITSTDIIFLVTHVFKGGPQPCDVCQASGLGWACP